MTAHVQHLIVPGLPNPIPLFTARICQKATLHNIYVICSILFQGDREIMLPHDLNELSMHLSLYPRIGCASFPLYEGTYKENKRAPCRTTALFVRTVNTDGD